MSETERAHLVQPAQPGRRRRRVLAAVLGLSILCMGTGAFSLAIFTSSASSTGTFAAGTVVLTSNPAVAFTVAGMMPGDTNTQALTIANTGTAQLRYAMTTTATNALGTTLTLTVKTLGTSCAAFDGTSVLAATVLNGAAIGSPTQGAQAGDRVLNGVSNEVLCFRVSLPLATGDALQGITSAVTFTFAAEQTANNP